MKKKVKRKFIVYVKSNLFIKVIIFLSLFIPDESLSNSCTISWYGKEFHGKKTANGEIFNKNSLTAAHKALTFGKKICIINPENNKRVIVRINDRGPYIEGREFDISERAARELGIIKKGTTKVYYKEVGY